LTVGTTLTTGGSVGVAQASPLWPLHVTGQVDGGKLVALALHNNTNTNNSDTAIRFINRSTSLTNEALRVGEFGVLGGSGVATAYARVADGTQLATAFTASSSLFYVPASLGVGLIDPTAPLTIAGLDATTANGASQIRLRSQRTTINAAGLGFIGGVDFQSNDTSLTAPGAVVASIQAIASATHVATDVSTYLRVMTTNGTTYSEVARFRQDGIFQVLGGINFGGTTLADYLEAQTWTPTISTDSGAMTFTGLVQTGEYSRVGNVVFCWGVVQWTTRTGGSGNVRIALPIAPKAARPALATGIAPITGGMTPVTGQCAAGQVQCFWYRPTAGLMIPADLAGGAASFYFSASYVV